MVSLPMDQFQFPDLNTNNAHKVEHDADLIVNPTTTQTLLEATAPTDHSASLHDISTIPGTELLISHSRAEIQSATKEQASFVKTKTESELRARILPLERLAERWQARDRSDEDME